MLRVKQSDIHVGVPLPWNCYDAANVLLLRRGTVIESERQIDGLIARGLFLDLSDTGRAAHEEQEKEVKSPFHSLGDYKTRLQSIFVALSSRQDGDIQGRIIKLCQDLQDLCDMDADAALGSLHLDHEGRYTVTHPLHTALLAELIARRKDLSKEERLCVLAAALTANIGMLDVQESLQRQHTPLTEEQKKIIRSHPRHSVELLLAAGIKNDAWLKAVLHHHEKPDGSGYPGPIAGAAIPLAALIISLADSYCAMISPRNYHAQLLSQDALRTLLLKRGKDVDEELVSLFIKEMGMLPPGALVKLKNGEIAVVVKRSIDHAPAEVKSVVGPHGAAIPTPVRRDLGDSKYAIDSMVSRNNSMILDLPKIWGYA